MTTNCDSEKDWERMEKTVPRNTVGGESASDMAAPHRDEQQGTRWAHLALAGQQHAGFLLLAML